MNEVRTDPNRGFLAILACIFAFCGMTFLVRAAADLSLLEHSSTTPKSITAATLSLHGPGDNYYVHITDYKLANPHIDTHYPDTKHPESYLVCDMIPAHPPKQKYNAIQVSNMQICAMQGKDYEQFLHSRSMNAFAHPPEHNEVKVVVKGRPSAEDSKSNQKVGGGLIFGCLICVYFAIRKKS